MSTISFIYHPIHLANYNLQSHLVILGDNSISEMNDTSSPLYQDKCIETEFTLGLRLIW